MSSKNDEGMAFAVVFAFIGIAAIFLFMLVAFAAFVLTILCLLAWNNPIGSGKFIITPSEAREFVGRGILGAFLLTGFMVFADVFFRIGVNWDYLLHIAAAGYTAGSLGVAIMMADEETPPPATAPVPQRQIVDYSPPVEKIILPPSRPWKKPGVPDPSFEYASWDDEEEAWR